MQKAEEIAEEFEFESFNNFSYHNAKYSTVDGKGHEDYINETLYAPMSLIPDKQFQNIPVNRNYSSVHVPTNIYDGGKINNKVRLIIHSFNDLLKSGNNQCLYFSINNNFEFYLCGQENFWLILYLQCNITFRKLNITSILHFL